MNQDEHFLRLRKYLSSDKPSLPIERYGVYKIFGGQRTNGTRPIICEEFYGRFGDALSHAIFQPEFYAHTLDIKRPYNDDPANKFNGIIADASKCQILTGNFGTDNKTYDKGLEKAVSA